MASGAAKITVGQMLAPQAVLSRKLTVNLTPEAISRVIMVD